MEMVGAEKKDARAKESEKTANKNAPVMGCFYFDILFQCFMM